MRRPALWLLLASSLLLVLSASFAQEEIPPSPFTGDQGGEIFQTGQTLTGVDSLLDSASGVVFSGDSNLSLSGEILSGTDGTGTQSGDILPPVTPPQTGNFIPSVPPSLLISEVFFDGSDERLELTNIGSMDFSGIINLTGSGINTSLFVSLGSGVSHVIGRSGRTFGYMIDTSVITYFATMSFTDTKPIAISLSRSGQILDHFNADTGMVVYYNDRRTSLERIWLDGIYMITGTTLDRQLNVSTDYIANPGSFQITALDFSPDPVESGANFTGLQTIDCQSLSSAPPLQISEIFWGNDQRDFYIEIIALQDFAADAIILSGSFLTTPTTISLASLGNHLQQGRRLIISSGNKRDNEQIMHIDNQGLAASESGGQLQILLGSGQSGQVLDIVAISSKKASSSLYFGGNTSGCIRNFDTRGRFSPGFDEAFLRYFPGNTGYKIICDRPVATIPISGPELPATGNNATGVIGPSATGTQIPEYMRKSIHIDFIDYNPLGSDTNNEKITFIASSLLGDIDLSHGWYLMIGTRKRYLRGMISSPNPLTLQASFAFPNSSKNSEAIVVQLWNEQTLVDSYSYIPLAEEKLLEKEKGLSGELLSGDEFIFTGEAKILWIIPNPKGADLHEQIAVKITETGRNFLSGFSFLINGKTKKIKESIPLNEEAILSGSFSFPNKAACVSLVFQKTTLDTLCYPQPTEGETIYADGRRDFALNQQEQSLVAAVSLKKIGNTMCAFYGNLQIDCNNIPSGKTATKTKNENKLYESFINILQPYLQQTRSDVFYHSNVYPYFSLLRAAKKNISAGQYHVMTSHGAVPAYDIPTQLRIIETYSPGYRAKRFGQVLLNEI